jgi:hypothetical protein
MSQPNTPPFDASVKAEEVAQTLGLTHGPTVLATKAIHKALQEAFEAGQAAARTKPASKNPPAFMTAKPSPAPKWAKVLRIGTLEGGACTVTRHNNGKLTVKTAQGLSAKLIQFTDQELDLARAARNATTKEQLAEAWSKYTGLATYID